MKITKPFRIVTCCVLIMTFSICFLLGGCSYVTYPYEKASSWVCNDPHIEVDYSTAGGNAYLEWDSEKIPIYIGMQASSINVYRLIPGQEGLRHENILFRGNWHYQGKKIVVKIYDDRIFDGAYTRLVFVPQ